MQIVVMKSLCVPDIDVVDVYIFVTVFSAM